MKKIFSAVLSVLMILLLLSGCSKAEYTNTPSAAEGNIGIVSFNCAAPWGSLTNNTLSSSRVKRFAAYMNAVRPDSIGTQEMNSQWMEKLEELMSDYDSYGVKRGGDGNEKKSEMNTIFWLKDKYTCLEANTFWLSETPDQESKYESAGCYRICSYVVLENKSTGETYIHLNTHLDNASEEAADFGATVIMEKLSEIKSSYSGAAVVLTGDFNETPGMAAYETVVNELYEARLIADETETKGTYTDWGKQENTQPIDYIFTSVETVSVYQVLDDTDSGYISDHYGIFAEITL